tara:strand:- start:340 stop:651 length:312 start_codon:yes stop_codon:yes gene_type:complete
MSKEENPDDFLPEMSEQEKYEVEQMLIDRAFENSYLILTNKTTMDKLMEKKSKFGMKAMLMYDPSDEPDEFLYDDIIDHFEHHEDYEKCAELLQLKNKMFKDV